MIDENEVDDVEEDVAKEAEEVTEEAEEQDNSEIEAKARRMGWVPEDEFRGPKNIWKDAASYVEHGENELPVLRERYKKQDARLAQLEQTIKKFPSQLAEYEKAATERITRELKEKQRQAVETGDVEAFDRIDQEIAQAQRAIEKKVEEPVEDQIVAAWEAENSWFNTDEDLTAYAVGLHQRTWNGKPETLEENLNTVSNKIREKFSEKFENPNRSKPAAVESGASKIKTKRGKSFDDLPPEAKAACNEFVQDKVLTKEQYVKSYFEAENT